MKLLHRYFLFLLLAAPLIGVVSCEKEDDAVSTGQPSIQYIRSTNPAKSDSLLVGSFMGSLIAIVGDNLQGVREMWFNDQKATLNPTYITRRTILVNVPSTVPKDVNDKMRLVFQDGSELLHDFKVNVPEPVLTAVKSEFVPDGEVMVLEGDFFFDPIKVVFTGDKQGEIVTLEKTRLEVRVPAGAQPGPISVQTNFGKVKSKFYFRDNRNTILDFDGKNHETWTAPIGNSNPTGCSGNYAYFKHNANGAWQWTNELTMQYWAPRGRGNVPIATGNLDDLVFKFECNVPVEWKDVRMEIFCGPFADDHGRDNPATAIARWKPWASGPFKTDGWQTISIPLKEFKYGPNDSDDSVTGTRSITNLSSATNVVMMLFGPANGTNPVFVCVDNIRIVPK